MLSAWLLSQGLWQPSVHPKHMNGTSRWCESRAGCSGLTLSYSWCSKGWCASVYICVSIALDRQSYSWCSKMSCAVSWLAEDVHTHMHSSRSEQGWAQQEVVCRYV